MSDISDFLEYLGEALDKPGRSVRGVLGGNYDEGAAAIPFSDSLGLTNRDRAISGTDLAKRWFDLDPESFGGQAAGMGISLATDPLTYAGGFLGRTAGRALGAGLDARAIARGPGYATLADDLLGSARLGGGEEAAGLLQRLMQREGGSQMLSEIPTGSRYLGHGSEAVAFQTPAGDVARLSGSGGLGRPVDPSILPSMRTAEAGGLRVERSPMAAPFASREGSLSPQQVQGIRDLKSDLGSRGLNFADSHRGNIGMLNDRAMVLDPGAVRATEGFSGMRAPVTAMQDPNFATRAILDMFGGQERMRRALAAGSSSPGFERQFGTYGAMGGAVGPSGH